MVSVKICVHSTGRYWAPRLAVYTVRCDVQGASTFWMFETAEFFSQMKRELGSDFL